VAFGVFAALLTLSWSFYDCILWDVGTFVSMFVLFLAAGGYEPMNPRRSRDIDI
jgi:hypothetical protein